MVLDAKIEFYKKELDKLGVGMFVTFFWTNEDFAELNQHCNHSCQSVNAVEGIEISMMEQVAALVKRVETLEACNGKQCLHISKFKWKVEQGEKTLLKCAETLEMVSSRVCHCNEGVVASGSGLREESLELEYTSGNEEFRIPPPDLMTLVLEGREYEGIFSLSSQRKID